MRYVLALCLLAGAGSAFAQTQEIDAAAAREAVEHVTRDSSVASKRVVVSPNVLGTDEYFKITSERWDGATGATIFNDIPRARPDTLSRAQCGEAFESRCGYANVDVVLSVSRPVIRGTTGVVYVQLDRSVEHHPGKRLRSREVHQLTLQLRNGSWYVEKDNVVLRS